MGSAYEIGPFHLDPALGVLTRAGVPQPLGARSVAVLAVLVRHANEYLSKAAIIEAAWPGLVVEESNLAVQVSAIRRVLAQAPGGERWIETLSRRGYRFVGPVAEAAPPGPARADRERSNLPSPLTSFVGRERELVEIKRLLPDARLLTLVGGGGIGKTRLALQVAAEVVDAYRDGVWLVELASIVDGTLVASTVAQTLGVQETVGAALVDSLCRHLKRRQMLLLLDNCEHVRGECAALATALLRAAPGTAIVATSREPLQVQGERIYALAPLSLPDPEADVATIARADAVQLFVERSRSQQRGFALTDSRAPAVARLCVHLDGIPLAIELAAARVRSLPVEQIVARLDDRFRLLVSGAGAAVPRQQTLRATFDWSFDLLADDERAVLRRVAVFAGGFTLDAASAVVAHPTMDECAVVDVLGRLVARSLVDADTTAVRARYRLLETTRAYAREKLVESGEAEAVRRRHAQHFVEFWKRSHDGWLRSPDAEWRASYLPELDNLRAALDWARAETAEQATMVALTAASAPVWQELSLHGEGRRRLQDAAARIDANTPAVEQARLHLWLGLLTSSASPVEAVAELTRAVELYRRMNDAVELGHALARLGAELAMMGRREEADSALAEAGRLLEHCAVPKVLARYCSYLAILKWITGDLRAARAEFDRASSLFRAAGSERQVVRMLGYVAELDWSRGDLGAAIPGFREVVARLREQPAGTRSSLGLVLANLAGALTENGELSAALAAAREALPLIREGGYLWLHLSHLALRVALAGNAEDAARLAGFADAVLAAKGAARQPNEARARSRLDALLCERLARDARERLLEEGSRLTEDEAIRVALQD